MEKCLWRLGSIHTKTLVHTNTDTQSHVFFHMSVFIQLESSVGESNSVHTPRVRTQTYSRELTSNIQAAVQHVNTHIIRRSLVHMHKNTLDSLAFLFYVEKQK